MYSLKRLWRSGVNRSRLHGARAWLGARAALHRGPVSWESQWGGMFYHRDRDLQEVFYYLDGDRWYNAEQKKLAPYLRAGGTVVDVGANLGFLAVLFSREVGAAGRVFAFEPSPTVFRKLQRNLVLNGVANVEVVNVGCGQCESHERLFSIGGSSGNASIVPAGSECERAAGESIRIITLDSFVQERGVRPDFLKIDTEGFESEVLAGAGETIRRFRPVIYVELSADYRKSSEDSIAMLREAGYRFDADPDLNVARNGDSFVATHPARK